MGGKSSKEEAEILSAGQINNNVIVEDHVQQVSNMFYILIAILAVNVFNLLYKLYRDRLRGVKKNAIMRKFVSTIPAPDP